MEALKYWKKDLDPKKLAGELSWNFPEQKAGEVVIVGGNSQNFATEVKLAEFLALKFPFLSEIRNFFPESLKKNLPSLPNFSFFPATENGSFRKSCELRNALKIELKDPACAIFVGDFSKNSETEIAVSELIENSPEVPTVIARDGVDLVANEAEKFLLRENVTVVASMAQLQKIFRAVYYPKMLLLSQPIFPIVETLHKFTLSYPVSILTFHEGKILCARNGNVNSVEIEKTAYSPISLWSGEVAARGAVFQMFNPGRELEALVAGINKD